MVPPLATVPVVAVAFDELLDGRDIGDVGQRRIPVARHAAVAGIAGVGVERYTLLVHGIFELAPGREAELQTGKADGREVRDETAAQLDRRRILAEKWSVSIVKETTAREIDGRRSA